MRAPVPLPQAAGRRTTLRGPAMAAAASVLVGLSVVATRLLVAPPRGADPLAVALLRNVVAVALTLALAPMLRVRGGTDRAPAAPGPGLRRDGPALALLGILGFCLFPFLFTAALRHAGAGRGRRRWRSLPSRCSPCCSRRCWGASG